MAEIVVIGGGHAGCEAALACANIGFNTILVTGNLNMVGSMPCNPSIGGPAKGVVVREIDALGGYMGKNSDLCQIQTKMLNRSKGPAVWALRFQEDKILYCKEMLKHLKATKNLTLVEAYASDLLVDDNKSIYGVKLEDGTIINCKAVIVTTGTYLDSRILRGHWTSKEGPDGQKTSKGISEALKREGIKYHYCRVQHIYANIEVIVRITGDNMYTEYQLDEVEQHIFTAVKLFFDNHIYVGKKLSKNRLEAYILQYLIDERYDIYDIEVNIEPSSDIEIDPVTKQFKINEFERIYPNQIWTKVEYNSE